MFTSMCDMCVTIVLCKKKGYVNNNNTSRKLIRICN